MQTSSLDGEAAVTRSWGGFCVYVRALEMTGQSVSECSATSANYSNVTLAPNRGRLTEQPAVTTW